MEVPCGALAYPVTITVSRVCMLLNHLSLTRVYEPDKAMSRQIFKIFRNMIAVSLIGRRL
jgi:hypothetical protein